MVGSRYELQIRSVTNADASGLADLLASVGQDVPVPILAGRLEAVRQQPGAALVAVEWGPPSGLAVLTWSRTLADDRPAARLDTLLVRPVDRRRGFGRALLKAAAQAARAAGCETLTLAAEADAPGLQAFCEATGFSRTGETFGRSLRRRPAGAGTDGGGGR